MTRSGFHPVGTRDRVLFELLPLASVNWLKAIISRIAAWRSWSDRAAKPSVILARPATPGFYRAMSFRVRMRSIFSASVRDCVIGLSSLSAGLPVRRGTGWGGRARIDRWRGRAG